MYKLNFFESNKHWYSQLCIPQGQVTSGSVLWHFKCTEGLAPFWGKKSSFVEPSMLCFLIAKTCLGSLIFMGQWKSGRAAGLLPLSPRIKIYKCVIRRRACMGCTCTQTAKHCQLSNTGKNAVTKLAPQGERRYHVICLSHVCSCRLTYVREAPKLDGW